MSVSKRTIAWLLLCSLLPVLNGCFWVVAGVGAGGGTAYYKGELKKVERVTIDQMWQASLRGVKASKLVVISSVRDKGEIIARMRNDTKVTIKLKHIAAQETEIRIRVGTFGDQELSVSILENIKRYL